MLQPSKHLQSVSSTVQGVNSYKLFSFLSITGEGLMKSHKMEEAITLVFFTRQDEGAVEKGTVCHELSPIWGLQR